MKNFTRRCFLLGAGKLALFFSLVGRLYYLQGTQGKHYKLLSDKNRIKTLFITPERGFIFDRSGQTLAHNTSSYKLLIQKQDPKRVKMLIEKVSALIPFSTAHLAYLKNNVKNFLVLRDHLSWEELSTIQFHYHELDGVEIEEGFSRIYVYPHLFSHTLGYLSPHKTSLKGLKVGALGVEKLCNEMLDGEIGVKEIEVDAARRLIRTLKKTPPQKGKNCHLTLDFNLQKKAYDLLSLYEGGVACVAHIQTGELLANVSYPGFDSNMFNSPLSFENWRALAHDPQKPLLNKATAGLYAPGSTFKMIVALAALEKGVIHEGTTCHCRGYIEVGTHKFHCWRWRLGGHGKVNIFRAIAESCDVFFYEIARKLSPEDIKQTASLFGFGEKTGLDIGGERTGLVPDKAWKEQKRKEKWTLGDTMNMSIGQGSLLSTPLQLLKMTMLIANPYHHQPLRCVKETQIASFPPLPFQEKHLHLVRSGMEQAVNTPGGTAFSSRLKNVKMAGKTGSTQVRRISKEAREKNTVNQGPTRLKEHGLFVGYLPVKEPCFAACVLVEHSGGGSRTAAPIGKKLLWQAYETL